MELLANDLLKPLTLFFEDSKLCSVKECKNETYCVPYTLAHAALGKQEPRCCACVYLYSAFSSPVEVLPQ